MILKVMSLQSLIDSIVSEELLKEGVMDNETTIISRIAVAEIKKHLASTKSAKLKKKTIEFQATVNNNPLDVVLELMPATLVKAIKANSGEFQTSRYAREPMPGETVPPLPTDRLVLNVVVPSDKRLIAREQWEPFVLSLKSVIRHELEHSRQKARGYKTTTSNKAELFGAEVDPERVFLDQDAALGYYTSPHEVEAYVMQIYKTAKMKKIPFTQAMKEYITGPLGKSIVQGMGVGQGIRVLNTIKKAWMAYAAKRLPNVT